MCSHGRVFAKRHIFFSVFMAASFLAAGVSYGLTLGEAREEALRVNLKVKLSREKVSEAASVKKQRYSDFFAKLDGRAYASHTEPEPHVFVRRGEYGTFPATGPVPSSDRTVLVGEKDVLGVAVRLEQPVFQGGRIYNSYRQSEAAEEALSHDEKKTAQDILLMTESAYIDLLKADELKRVAEQHLKTVEAHMNDMQLLYNRGRAAQNDVLKVKVELARAGEALIVADNDMRIAAGRLNAILDRPFMQSVEPEALSESKKFELSPAEAEQLALLNRADMKSAYGRAREAAFRTKAAEADYYPGLKFMSEYVRQTQQPTTNNDEWSVMMLLEYRLWDFGGRSNRVAAAKSTERQRQLDLMTVESVIYSEVHESLLNVKAADKRVDVTKEALHQADENLRITKFGFEHGAKTSTDVLDAEDLKMKTNSEHIRARYDSHHARAVFRHAVGLMHAENLEESARR